MVGGVGGFKWVGGAALRVWGAFGLGLVAGEFTLAGGVGGGQGGARGCGVAGVVVAEIGVGAGVGREGCSVGCIWGQQRLRDTDLALLYLLLAVILDELADVGFCLAVLVQAWEGGEGAVEVGTAVFSELVTFLVLAVAAAAEGGPAASSSEAAVAPPAAVAGAAASRHAAASAAGGETEGRGPA